MRFGSVLDNLASLALAFLLALMVWMVAVNQDQGTLTREMFPEDGVPIETINTPPGLVVFDDITKRARVEVRAPRANIERISPSDVRAYVDLAGLSPGLHEVPVQWQCAPCREERVDVRRVEPDRISVRLDEAAERIVPVSVNLQGSTAVGYRARQPLAVPDEVTVTGPRSLVDQVDSVVADVYLFNQDTTVDRDVQLSAVDAEGNLVNGVAISPERATITVPIVPESGRKEVTVSPNIQGDVALGYWISNIKVTPQTVVLTGLPSRIREAPGLVETEPVNVAGATGTVETQVPVQIPGGLQLADTPNEIVTVRVEVSPFTGGRSFEVTPVVDNLDPGLVAELSPPKVQVIVEGPVPQLEQLEQQAVQVVLDLEGLGPGRHRIQPLVNVGSEVLQVQTLPAAVEVTIHTVPTPTRAGPSTTPPPTR
jgi:YbbR domain-containing protein